MTNSERRAAEAIERKKHQTRLEQELGLTGHPKADLLYQKAWDAGHAYGFNEVEGHYRDLAELLLP